MSLYSFFHKLLSGTGIGKNKIMYFIIEKMKASAE